MFLKTTRRGDMRIDLPVNEGTTVKLLCLMTSSPYVCERKLSWLWWKMNVYNKEKRSMWSLDWHATTDLIYTCTGHDKENFTSKKKTGYIHICHTRRGLISYLLNQLKTIWVDSPFLAVPPEHYDVEPVLYTWWLLRTLTTV